MFGGISEMESKNTSKLLALTVAGFCAASTMSSTAQAKSKKTSKKAAVSAEVHCMGVNECKGKGECASAANSCSGQNACAKQGWVKKASAEDCTQAGGTIAKD
jgi:hypothetical protein